MRRRERERELREIGERASKVPLPPVEQDEDVPAEEERKATPAGAQSVVPVAAAPAPHFAPPVVVRDEEAAPIVAPEPASDAGSATMAASPAPEGQDTRPAALPQPDSAALDQPAEIVEPPAPVPCSAVADEKSLPDILPEASRDERLDVVEHNPQDQEPLPVPVPAADQDEAAPEIEPDQHDLVEESVGMDSDYLVESQGIEQAEEDAQEESTVILEPEPARATPESTPVAQATLGGCEVPARADQGDTLEPQMIDRAPCDEGEDGPVEVDEAASPLLDRSCEQLREHSDVSAAPAEPEADDYGRTEAVEAVSESVREKQEDEEPDVALSRLDRPLSPEGPVGEPADEPEEVVYDDELSSPNPPASPTRLPPASSPAASPASCACPPVLSTPEHSSRYVSRSSAHHPTPSPGSLSRPDAPFTPVSSVPVRFSIAVMPYSPEPFQTRSIILDTPPRFESFAAIRLPRRPAAGPPAHEAAAVAPDALHDDSLANASPRSGTGCSHDESEADVEPSAHEQQVYAPPQPRFFPDAQKALESDADTTYDDNSFLGVRSQGPEPFGSRVQPTEEAVPVLDERSEHVEYSTPLKGGSPSHVSKGLDETVPQSDFDDSASVDARDAEQEADETLQEAPEVSASQAASSPSESSMGLDSARMEAGQKGPNAGDEEEDDDFGAPGSPAGTTLDFSDFTAPPSTSTPSGRERRPLWDESILGDESANFELEQPGLRFHDETQSEHNLSSTVLGDFDVSGNGPTQFVPDRYEDVEAEPPVLQRSLRSRVVTVDLSSSTSKTPARNTRAATASAHRNALTEVQR